MSHARLRSRRFSIASAARHCQMALSRIYVVGAQSTGKTTLVNALAEHFREPKNRLLENGVIPKPVIIKEVARNAFKEYNLTAIDILSTKGIAGSAIDIGGTTPSRNFFAGPMLYAGEEAMAELRDSVLCNELVERLRESLVLVCEPCIKRLVDDGVRLMPRSHEEWMNLHRYFCQLLQELGIEFIVLGKELNTQERVQIVLPRLYGHDVPELTCEQ